jgi:hypothetical protein
MLSLVRRRQNILNFDQIRIDFMFWMSTFRRNGKIYLNVAN